MSIEKEDLKTRTIITLALDTGARRGEITGLNWSDVNFEKNTIFVNKVTQKVDGKIIEKPPKTNSSIRVIPITTKTTELLKQYKSDQDRKKMLLGNKWIPTEKIFTKEF